MRQDVDPEASPSLRNGSLSPGGSAQAIQVMGLRKGFGQQPVLWDLDLTVGWGECVALFGANGAGKTTLLRVLSTQGRAESGMVRIAGSDTRTDATAVRRAIGVVSHLHLLYDNLTAAENLRFYGRMFSVLDLQPRIAEVLRRVGLEGREGQRVRAFSNGLQKRLAIGRAILHHPSVLLLDEPEAGLDPGGLDMLGGLIQEWKGRGGSILMATHNLERGREWADRVAVLARGKIAFSQGGQHPDVVESGASPRVSLEVT